MRATLSFNLDDPFDRQSHMRALKATDVYHALHEISGILDIAVKSEVPPTLYDLRQDIWDAIRSSGVDLSREYT